MVFNHYLFFVSNKIWQDVKLNSFFAILQKIYILKQIHKIELLFCK
jgi:hypothetical protein